MSPRTSPPVGIGTPLPRPLTRLIARDQEVAAVVSLLRDHAVRLLTLTGPGGVGKTRLAIAAAADVAPDFPDGVTFIDFSPVSNAGLVPTAIARSLGLRDSGAESLQNRLLASISDRRLLLLLDNFEQLVVAAPGLRPILDICPNVTILVTSRIRLRISGEQEYPVAPLPVDLPAQGADSQAPGAVLLFLERAKSIRPDFDGGAETLSTVTEIVRRVDGLPLAIELAAARIKALPPAALLQRLEHRLPLLSGGARDLPLRQQTMRDTIGWSFGLLNDAEQALFSRLGVFVGGFTLEAAEAICGNPTNAPSDVTQNANVDVIDEISALIEHSLLGQSATDESEPRYRMLETVHEYARDRLNHSSEFEAVTRRHAAYFLAYAEASGPELMGPKQSEWLGHLDREKENLRAALNWTLDEGEVDTATRLGAMLWRFWERRGYVSEGRSQLARILALRPSQSCTAARCSSLTGAGVLAAIQGDYDEAIRHSEDALSGWQELGDHQGIAQALLCLAIVGAYQDDYAKAQLLGNEALAAFRTANDQWGIGHTLTHLGMVAWVQGHHAAGTRLYEDAYTCLREVGDDWGIFAVLLELGKGASDEGRFTRATGFFEECLALCTRTSDESGRGATLSELGVVARLQGDHARATGLLMEAMAVAQNNGDRRQVAYIAAHLGDVHIATGDIKSAASRYAEALSLFRPMGNRVGIAQCLEAIGRCAAAQGNIPAAIRLIGSSDALFATIGATPPPDRNPASDAAFLKSRLSPETLARLWEEGRALDPAAAAAEALSLATDLARDGVADSSTDHQAAVSTPAAKLGLTPREVEVLRLLADGMSDREIAETLSISERTAGNHVQHAMQKIGVESRTAAAVFAVRNNLA